MSIGEIHRATERRFSAWKNGGGETAEIICHPAGAGFDGFEWRISTAHVAESGPFSRFPGTDRVLTVVEGGDMTLTLADGTTHRIGPGSSPFAFPGDVPCSAELHGPPLLDLNVMVRRPLRAEVLTEGQQPSPGRCQAKWLFALRPLPDLHLRAHDLLELASDADMCVPKGALMIVIGAET
jgi:environmental stress-induced protein Ves